MQRISSYDLWFVCLYFYQYHILQAIKVNTISSRKALYLQCSLNEDAFWFGLLKPRISREQNIGGFLLPPCFHTIGRSITPHSCKATFFHRFPLISPFEGFLGKSSFGRSWILLLLPAIEAEGYPQYLWIAIPDQPTIYRLKNMFFLHFIVYLICSFSLQAIFPNFTAPQK